MRIWFTMSLIFTTLCMIAQNTTSEDKGRYYFGFTVAPSTAGGMVSYGYIQVSPQGNKKITWLNKNSFIMQATGQERSIVNPDSINYFEEHQIYWQTLGELWKLRYREYPFHTNKKMGTGWANGRIGPSPGQRAYLKQQYDMENINSFIYGENAWQLLKDMQDPNWRSQYQSMD